VVSHLGEPMPERLDFDRSEFDYRRISSPTWPGGRRLKIST